jgi:hypothetical protein
MKKRLFKNYKTTLAGILAASPFLIEGIVSQNYFQIAKGLGLFLMGAGAKDFDKTGTSEE